MEAPHVREAQQQQQSIDNELKAVTLPRVKQFTLDCDDRKAVKTELTAVVVGACLLLLLAISSCLH